MILIDVNLLIYAVNRDAPLHAKAKSWLETVISGTQTVALSWNVLLAFIRLTTRPGLFRQSLEIEAALNVVTDWLNQPQVTVIHPGPRHWQLLRELLLNVGTAGNLTSDAHLAALAVEHDAELCSLDSDFSRFPQLRWRNPLA